MAERFDAIIIGSGMGGLTAARFLSAFGVKRIVVLEQHTTLGGLTHVFSRPKGGGAPDYEFATGVHYLGRNTEAASLPALLAQITERRVQWQALPEPYDTIVFPGWSFAIPNDEVAYKARLIERFPHERDAIERFFRDTRRASRGLVGASLVNMLPRSAQPFARRVVARLFPLTFERLKTYLDRSVGDPALKALLAAQWGNHGSPPSDAAFGIHATVLRHYIGGAIYPLGGPAQISRSLIDILRRDGCQLRSGQLVREILIEQGRAVGVRGEAVRNGETFEMRAPLVISTTGARNTYGALLPAAERKGFAPALAELRDGPSALVLFLGLRESPAKLGFAGGNHWIYPSDDHEAVAKAPPGEGVVFLSFPSLKNAAAASHTMEVVSFVQPDAFRAWAGEAWPRHAPDYLALKQRLVDRLLERIEAYAPGFRQLVALAELATPLTFTSFQRCHDGAFYGLDSSPERLLSPLTSAKTDIPGLFLGGEDACSPGVISSLLGGLFAASAALGLRARARLWSTFSLRRVPERSLIARRPGDGPWKGLLKVAAITAETPTVKTFQLEDPDQAPLPFAFRSGQFLTLALPGAGGKLLRHYSISSAAAETRFCTITVKREPEGYASSYLHDAVKVGQCLEMEGPSGRFTLEHGETAPSAALLLISGGVGITPIMSLVRQLQATRSSLPVTLIAAFRTPEEIIYREELRRLAASMPTLTLRLLVEVPDAGWRGDVGRPDKPLIAAAVAAWPELPRVHLCGPAPMMAAVKGILSELGIAPELIHTEDFKAPVGETIAARDRAIQKIIAAAPPVGTAIRTLAVAFRDSGRSVQAAPGQSLLEIALAHDIPLRHVCGAGICGECRVRIRQGTLETDDLYGVLTQSERERGFVLACRSYPTGDMAIDA